MSARPLDALPPADKVAVGLALAREGFAELRDEALTLARWQAENRAATAGGEGEALALRFEAMRGRASRVQSGTLPSRTRLRDDGALVPAAPGAEEARSLALYCPRGARAALPVAHVERPSRWARWWAGLGREG